MLLSHVVIVRSGVGKGDHANVTVAATGLRVQGSHVPSGILHVRKGLFTLNTSYLRIHQLNKGFNITWNEDELKHGVARFLGILPMNFPQMVPKRPMVLQLFSTEVTDYRSARVGMLQLNVSFSVVLVGQHLLADKTHSPSLSFGHQGLEIT